MMAFCPSLEERQGWGDSLHSRRDFFRDGHSEHAQVFAGEERAKSLVDGGIAGNVERTAAIDGGAQVSKKQYTRGAILNVLAHLIAGGGFRSAVDVLGEIREKLAAFSGALSSMGKRILRIWLGWFADACHPGRAFELVAHLFANTQSGAMEANPHGPGLQVENLRNLIGGQILHIVEHKDDAQRRGNAQDCAMEQIVLLGVKKMSLGILSGIL